jgi:cobalt-zinc-cadmium efflux system protein
MAHIRKPLGIAVALNTTVFGLELVGGLGSRSSALVADAAHNLSDELALVCLWLAYLLTISVSRGLQRMANLLNSLGLVAISAVLAWQAVDRVLHPPAVAGWVPIAIGLVAAAGNWGVARTLRRWRHTNAAVELAYLHNLGDIQVSLAPVVAGVLVTGFGTPVIDPLIALLVCLWLLGTTTVALRRSAVELRWPDEATCPHDELAVT